MKSMVLFVLLFFTITYSQWQRVESIPEVPVYFIQSEGESIYAATDSLIYVSRDNGESWLVLSEQSPKKNSAIISANGVLYAGTFGNGVSKSTDGGLNWQEINNNLSAWAKYVVSFELLNNRIYLGSDGGGVYFLDLSNPVEWIEYNENLPSNVAWTVNCMEKSHDNLLISSGANGLIYKRKEGSPEWSEYYIDSLRKPQAWELFSFNDYLFAGTNRIIFRSSDDGMNWDSVGIRALALRSSVIKSYNNVLYAALIKSNEFWIWTSADNGNTWNFMDHQFFNLLDLHITGNKIFAACFEGLYYNNIVPVSVDEQPQKDVLDISLSAYPNPFNPETIIKTEIPEDGFGTLDVFNINGEKIAELFNGKFEKGVYNHRLNGENLSGGVYICTLSIKGRNYSEKILLIK